MRLPFRLRRALFSGDDESLAEDADTSSRQPEPEMEPKPESNSEVRTPEYFPGLWDVLRVRYMLQWKISHGLPVELVDVIVDAAEYWPSIECRMQGEKTTVVTDRDQVLVKTVPLCYDRKVCQALQGYIILLTRSIGFGELSVASSTSASDCPPLPQGCLSTII